MNVLIFGATGMVGYGVLLELIDSPAVARILSIGRRTLDIEAPKLEQLVHTNYENFDAIADKMTGFEACMWCIGVPSAGLTEEKYTTITYAYTMAAAKVLVKQSPDMRFCFVSGEGADSSESGRSMWARVKGKAENALIALPFKEVVIFRPGFIKAERGSKPRGALYKTMYAIFGVLAPVMRWFGAATSTTEIGKAMIAAAQGKAEKQILRSVDINALATRAS
ncbi:MAG: epimerase [Bacteroidota bacterium]